jgi:hypothetical protein
MVVAALCAGCRQDRSPRTLEEAVAVHDYDSTLRFCEYYFDRLPNPDPDFGHTRLVREVYRKAFVRWSVSRRGPITRSAETRIERFRRYGASSPEGGRPK